MNETDLIGQEISGYNGTYQIEKRLARGSRANIYRVVSTDLQQYACAKILAFQMTDDDLRMMQREEMFLSRLGHPNIVKLYDTAVIGGFYCTIMEYFPDGSLADRLRSGPLNHDDLIRILEQVAAAVDFAHDNSVVHQDIKPSNILLQENRAALSDFGIARVFGEQVGTKSGTIGTPLYMAPEQAYGERPRKESDVYALGVVAFQALTGRVPFKGDTPMSTLMAIVNEPLPDLRDVNPDISAAVNDVVRAAMARQPANRYDSATAFVQSLRQALRNPHAIPVLPQLKESPAPMPEPPDRPTALLDEVDTPPTASFTPVPPPLPDVEDATVMEGLYPVPGPGAQEALAFRQRLLLQEANAVQSGIAAASRFALTIKAVSLIVWWGSLALGLAVAVLRPFLLATALIPLLFWLAEFLWRWYGHDYQERLAALTFLLNNPDFLQSFDKADQTQFPLFDPLGTDHRKSGPLRTFFEPQLFPVYLLQIAASLVAGLWL